MILDDLPETLSPIVQVIDDWNTCRKLGLAFEAKVGNGKLLLCSIELEKDLAARPVARQLRHSLLRYMASDDFAPDTAVTLEALEALLREPSLLQKLEAEVTADSQQVGYEAASGAGWESRHDLAYDLGRAGSPLSSRNRDRLE